MNRREQGIVSLTISIIVSILLMVIVVGMYTIMIRVQREATDADLSIRAHYAAEAGVEDALTMISRKLKDPADPLDETDFTNTCNNSGAELGADNSYTCQRLSHTTNKLEGKLERDGQPVQLDLGTAKYNKIVIQWNKANDATGNGVGTGLYSPPPNFPGAPGALGSENWTHPAVLEISSINFPTGNFDASLIEFYSNIITPGTSGGPTNNPDFQANANIAGDCRQSSFGGSYTCTKTIIVNPDDTKGHVLRLRSRYASTQYSVELLLGNVPVPVPDQFVTIDVTARAGDVYRRIIYQVRLETGSAAVDYVIFSDTDICKNFSVSLGAKSGGCPFP